MVKPVWIAVAFAGGIAVGLLLARSGKPEVATPVVTIDAAPERRAAPEVRTEPMRDATPAPAEAGDESPADSPPAAKPVPEVAAEYTGYLEPIEVGPVFRKTLAASPLTGTVNPLADAHRALEREMRDDSWSYPLEAELQNSLVADSSIGNFTVEHVVCRATACEIRLSGKDDQGEAMSRWSDTLQTPQWRQRLLLTMSSSISENGQVDRLIILKKPPKPPKPD